MPRAKRTVRVIEESLTDKEFEHLSRVGIRHLLTLSTPLPDPVSGEAEVLPTGPLTETVLSALINCFADRAFTAKELISMNTTSSLRVTSALGVRVPWGCEAQEAGLCLRYERDRAAGGVVLRGHTDRKGTTHWQVCAVGEPAHAARAAAEGNLGVRMRQAQDHARHPERTVPRVRKGGL